MDNAQATDESWITELKAVIEQAQRFLQASAGQTGEQIQAARAHVEASMHRAKQHLSQVEGKAVHDAQEMAAAAEDYVRENPWQAVGAAAGVGLVIGLLLSRR